MNQPGPETWMEENDNNGDPDPYVPEGADERSAAKPPVIGWGWRWQSDWVPWFERGPEPFVWRLNIGPLHIVRITERAARGDLSGS